jgi:N,N'-diacetyllegionaminate synthase
MTSRCLIIAEAGVNHNGDMRIARDLIEAAAEAGADLVKFQTFSANSLVTERAPKANYQLRTTGSDLSQYQMLKALELDHQMHLDLIAKCKESGIEFFSTAFDIQSLDYLSTLGAKRFKVPSGEITNLPYLLHMAAFEKPILLSTGMSNLGEIEDAIEAIESAGLERRYITVLHCNTEYPTPFGDVNLNALESIKRAFGVSVGYSDHTLGIEIPIAAVAMGAQVIEKHLTLDRNLPGPDHRASVEPDEFRNMVRSVRNIEMAMGDGVKRVTQSERENREISRKSLVAIAPIRKGDKFSPKNIGTKRPGKGISPMRWHEMVSRVATRDYFEDELIEL